MLVLDDEAARQQQDGGVNADWSERQRRSRVLRVGESISLNRGPLLLSCLSSGTPAPESPSLLPYPINPHVLLHLFALQGCYS